MRGIILNGSKIRVAPGMAVQSGKDKVKSVFEKIDLVRIIPPGQPAAVEEDDDFFMIYAKFPDYHILTPSRQFCFYCAE